MKSSGPFTLFLLIVSLPALAQNGLSDERVSLPDGPGSIGGVGENVAVNPNMGSATFSVPIRVPAGASELMTPELSLSYASGAGLGLAGIGWDLGIPTIERTVSKGLPSYTTDDLFAADGSDELVYVGELDGARVYRARFERGFVRYRWHEAGTGAGGYWTAEYPDGSVGTFGATSDGALVAAARVSSASGATFRYHLVELRDPVGRKIAYTYTKDAGWPLVDEIRYGFGGQATPRFSVRVGYEDRPDITSNATPGHVVELRKRIREIRVLSEAQTIRRYELGYEDPATSGGMSRLAMVTEYGRDGGRLEIEHTFRYSRSLGGACEIGCEQPFMVDMGTLPGGVNIQTGRASLIDINGDSLPDVVASDASGNHTFHVSALSADGRPGFTGDALPSAMGGTDLKFVLGAPSVQLLDVNGDGFTDIVNQQTGAALCNFGTGDWVSEGCVASPDQLPALPDDADDPASDANPEGMRFFDFDNDKRIDLLRTPTANVAFVERNTGGGFETVSIDAVGARFDEDNLQLADVNGDGLQDPVLLVGGDPSSTLRYRLNLGRGAWAPFVDVTIPGLSSAEADDAQLEDLDGDGLPDVVVVAGNTVSYWRNENGGIAARTDITSADVDGDIPERDGSQTVLFADMNGNGTDDVVWVRNDGNVRFLELFPVRPNLLSRIENGIGWVRLIEYGTSIAERARDQGTADAWVYKLPLPMVVVKATDTFVTLTASDDGSGIHERTELVYHDGFYDGAERAFRGFGRVERLLVADPLEDGQDPGREVLIYDLGADDPYRAGLQLSSAFFGGPALDVPLSETRTEYVDCDVAEVPAGVTPPVRHLCVAATTTILQEGAPESEWVTTRTELDHDGYGNVLVQRELGVVHMGPPESPGVCGGCDATGGLVSGACGASCVGDERVTETTYVVSGTDTSGAWLLHLPVRVVTYSEEGGAMTEVVSHYDGEPFVGLPEGQATRGLLTRQLQRIDESTFVPLSRSAYDAMGNVVATLDPNGDAADAERHRRDYVYDARGLRVTRVTIQAGAYDLVQEVTYESSFLQPSESTAFFVVDDSGEPRTPRNSTRYRYDEHGRQIAIIEPGDSEDAPTREIAYELGDPVSRIVVRARKEPGGDPDTETLICLDGRARQVQSRVRTTSGSYLVDGFHEVNSRNVPVRVYQSYTSATPDCDAAPPADVPFTRTRHDALGRVVEVAAPDEGLYGSASVSRTVYAPLMTISFDEEDNDESSPHAGTPLRVVRDGLERTLRFERLLDPATVATYRLFYDELGQLARIEDPAGNGHVQSFDLAGRVLSVESPNAGTMTYVHDAAGNVLSSTDARGVTVAREYDALNRLVATYDVADRAGTEETTRYDLAEACADCRNGAGRIVARSWPEGSDLLGYDPRGRRVLLRRSLEGISFTTRYVWDGLGKLVSTTHPDGQIVAYEYDDASRVTAIPGVIPSATYDDRGLLSAIEHANGVESTLEYDVLQRPSRMAAGDFFDVAVTRDRVGNVLEATSGGSGLNRAASYGYDAWYRLTSATLGIGEELSASYDLLDNVTRRTSSKTQSRAHVGDYAYEGARPNAVTTAGERAYAYDEAGNTTTRADLSLVWDHLGRLVSATRGDDAPATFGYAPSGERVRKAEHGGMAYYPAPDFVVRDGISSVYVKLDGRRVARLQRDDLATTVLPDQNGDDVIDVADAVLGAEGPLADRFQRAAARRLLFEAAGSETHLHADFLRSTIAATNAEGELLAERSFYPFGEAWESTGFVDDFGFTGQELDESTGLHHFAARYLDTGAGRWASPDPAFLTLTGQNIGRLGESTTAYAYVANNPVNAIDPTGLGLFKTLRRMLKSPPVNPRRQRIEKAVVGGQREYDNLVYGVNRICDACGLDISKEAADDLIATVGKYRRGEISLADAHRNEAGTFLGEFLNGVKEGDLKKSFGAAVGVVLNAGAAGVLEFDRYAFDETPVDAYK